MSNRLFYFLERLSRFSSSGDHRQPLRHATDEIAPIPVRHDDLQRRDFQLETSKTIDTRTISV